MESVGVGIYVSLAVPKPVEAVGVADSIGVNVIVGQVRPTDVREAVDDWDGWYMKERLGVGVACGISPQCDNDGV